jgi:hypothetical protein
MKVGVEVGHRVALRLFSHAPARTSLRPNQEPWLFHPYPRANKMTQNTHSAPLLTITCLRPSTSQTTAVKPSRHPFVSVESRPSYESTHKHASRKTQLVPEASLVSSCISITGYEESTCRAF